MKPHQDGQDEPFFITEEIEAEMIAAGYVHVAQVLSYATGCRPALFLAFSCRVF